MTVDILLLFISEWEMSGRYTVKCLKIGAANVFKPGAVDIAGVTQPLLRFEKDTLKS